MADRRAPCRCRERRPGAEPRQPAGSPARTRSRPVPRRASGERPGAAARRCSRPPGQRRHQRRSPRDGTALRPGVAAAPPRRR